MKSRYALLPFLVLALGFSGCATYFPNGLIFTEIKSGTAVGPGDVAYTKTGVCEAQSVLGLIATGDISIKTACANGGIKTIKFVDYDVQNVLGIIGKYKITVYGD